MTIAITGAAGQLGSLVAQQLLERIAPEELILVTRRPEALTAFADRGVQVRRADFDEPATLEPAFAGAERLLLVSSTHESTPRRVRQHTDAVAAARAAGVRHVAFTSMPKVDADHPTGEYALEYLRSEEMLKASGVDWTILQNAPYAEYLVGRFALALSLGRLATNAGDGATAPVSNADCAAVAVAVLTSEGHERQTYVVTGPELYTQAQLAALVADVTGHPLPLLELDDDALRRQAAEDGIPDPMPTFLSRHLKAVRLGYFDDLTTVVADLTGRPPRALRDVLVEHRDALLAAVPA
ncbi:MAG TPA: NAD(P)H-binding protein [Baekduia sp.]